MVENSNDSETVVQENAQDVTSDKSIYLRSSLGFHISIPDNIKVE